MNAAPITYPGSWGSLVYPPSAAVGWVPQTYVGSSLTNPAAQINAAFSYLASTGATSFDVVLDPSTYTIEAQIIIPSGGRLVCWKRGAYARLVPANSYTEASADADTGVILVQSTVAGASSGTTQRAARKHTRNLRLNFDPGAGALLRVKSTSAIGGSGTQFVTYTTNIQGLEFVRVVSTAAAGGGNFDCLLDQPLWQNHGSGSQVMVVSSLKSNAYLEGIFLDFAGKTHAAGIVLDAVENPTVINCKFSGFSRGQLVLKGGSRGAVFQDNKTALGTNCVMRIESSDYHIDGVKTVRGGARKHASGIVRAGITVRWASRGILENFVLEGMSCAISVWGGSSIVRHGIIRDMDPSLRAASDTELPTLASILISPHALDFGCFASPSNWGEFGLAHEVRDVRIEDSGGIDGGGQFLYPAGYFCDIYGLAIDACSVINTGADLTEGGAPELAGYATGFVFYDCFDATARALTFKGIESPIRLEGNANFIRFGPIAIDPFDGLTNVLCSFLRVGNAGASQVTFEDVKLLSADGYLVRTGYSAPSAAMLMAIKIDRLEIANIARWWTGIVFARQTEAVTAARGEEFELFDTTVSAVHCRGARNPSDARESTKMTAICGLDQAAVGPTAQNTWGLFAMGRERAVKTSSTPLYGDTLKAGTGRDLVTDAAIETKGVVLDVVANGLAQTKRAA